jgi:hypothetical protein
MAAVGPEVLELYLPPKERKPLCSNTPSQYQIYTDGFRREPYQIAKLGKLHDAYKLELLEVELAGSDEFRSIEDLPRFAVSYCNVMTGSITVIADLFRKFMSQKGIDIPPMRNRHEIPPKLLEELIQIVEGKNVSLCGECGKVCKDEYCSVKCETLRFKLKCSTIDKDGSPCAGTGVIDGGIIGVFFCNVCGCVVMQRTRGTKKRVLNPEELIEDPTHISTWKKSKRSSA